MPRDTPTRWTKAELSAPRRQLLETMQRILFGRIEGLVVSNGEPVLTPKPRIVRDINLGTDSVQVPELDDYRLKRQVVELLAQLERIGDGVVKCLEIRHGLPFRLTLEDRFEGSG
ncbi:MAG: hypothetical protein FJW20_20030 [Acidimicrobiia bacterium]|nr:hypothetical protein [Acidimicrobiia bacterium]